MRKVAIVTIWGYDCPEDQAVFDSAHSSFDNAVKHVVELITKSLELTPVFTVKGSENGLEYTTVSCGMSTETPVHFNVNENYLYSSNE